MLPETELSVDISGAWVSMFEDTITTAPGQTLKCELASYHVKLI